VAETESRLNGLQEKCLTRDDYHRCVITRVFDYNEARIRVRRDGVDAKDDDNHLLNKETVRPKALQVAHIISHSLMASCGQLDSKTIARNILNMFDDGVLHLIDLLMH